jgi:cytoskeleton protein RodZ
VAKASAALRLVFDREAWAEIKDQSGKTLSRQVNLRGSELRVEGIAPFTLVVGHAASVHLYYRDKQVDLTSYINASSDVARLTLE